MENEKPAGFWIRMAEVIIDLILLASTELVIVFSTLFEMGKSSIDTAILLFDLLILILITIPIVYFAIMPASKCQGTFGKLFLKLKIVDQNGDRLYIENLYCVFWLYTKLLIYQNWLYHDCIYKGEKGLHDRIAGTYVVKKQKAESEKKLQHIM
ncbi:RDD family protein [Bacillaceae bacterium Marseille-Q3522]|nr:RDD family protein [Bacillaceae bacterium Marseille-Q3522]